MIGDMNVFPSYYGRGKYEPIVRSPIKQAYLAHETGINASRTIGSFSTYSRHANSLAVYLADLGC